MKVAQFSSLSRQKNLRKVLSSVTATDNRLTSSISSVQKLPEFGHCFRDKRLQLSKKKNSKRPDFQFFRQKKTYRNTDTGSKSHCHLKESH